jgi:ABC-type lipoprotein export system ATPase subunit
MSAEPLVSCENLVKIYTAEGIEVVALQGLDLAVGAGEVMGIIGNSGSGKSTLLNIIGGLDRPSAGTVRVDGRDLLKLGDAELVEYRSTTVGFVWQNNARNLVPYLTAEENVEIPMLIGGALSRREGTPSPDEGTRSRREGAPRRRERARELLALVGLAKRSTGKLAELSGGEQQRVAIAIALANRPRLLLADEPTGEVDTATAMLLLDVFREASAAYGVTVIVVTHDPRISRKMDRIVAIRDGRTSSELVRRGSYAAELAALGDARGDALSEETHEELAVVDRAGRLQVPRELLEELGITGTVKIERDGERIVLRRPGDGRAPGGARGPGSGA